MKIPLPQRPRRLQTILSFRLLFIATFVIIANIVMVVVFDASDRDSLKLDLLRREVLRLEEDWLSAERNGTPIIHQEDDIYSRFPEAYGFAVLDLDGQLVDGRNAQMIPSSLITPGALSDDWLAWPEGAGRLPVAASHDIAGSEPRVRVLFYMTADPADLIGAEIIDEFRGHVVRPIVPVAILLIAGSLLVIGKALSPVKRAAAWARAIRPGQVLPPLDLSGATDEVLDLTEAVRRSFERLNAELSAEQRRAAEAAHALRTPVAVLVARMDELPKGPPYDEVRADVQALSRMATQYLSSAGADRLELKTDDRAELNAISEDVVAELIPLAIKMDSDITFSASPVPQLVHGAADAIRLALTNLVENAILHGGPGHIEVAVGPGPVLTVSDSGPGLAGQNAEDLFRPFLRGAGAPRGGAGLGLAIVARVQLAHGGRVETGTAPGGGALFRLVYREATSA
jgi:two-component system, OmpR family, sensor kinase